MKKILLTLLAVAGLAIASLADTSTTRIGLTKPDIGSINWGPKVNANYDILDATVPGLAQPNTYYNYNHFEGSTTITWNDMRSQLFSGPYFNVLDYGVKTDSVTYVDTLVNSIMNSTVPTTGGNIFFPPGDYAVGPGDGINILRDNVNLVFAPGAWLHKWGSGGTITIGRQPSTTVNHVGIIGANITSTSTVYPNAGIVITPDDTNAVNYLLIDRFFITGMSQYGIEGGGTINHLYVMNGGIYNNGASTESWVSQAYDVFPRFYGTDFVADNVYFQQSFTPAASAETDACKIQGFDGVRVSNLTAEGGGSSLVTGASLIFSNNSNLTASNIHIIGHGGTGMIVTTSTSNPSSIIDVVTTSGTFGSNQAFYFGGDGTTNLTMSHLDTDQSFQANASTHTNFTLEDSRIDGGFTVFSATLTNSVVRNVRSKSAFQITGVESQVIGCTSYKRSGSADAFFSKGSSNTYKGNIAIQPSAYCFRTSASSDTFIDNYCQSPAAGAYVIGSGSTRTVIESPLGQADITDSGTNTIPPYISSATATSGGIVPTSAVYFDVISTFTLTPGNWDIWGTFMVSQNGATFTSTDIETCIGTSPGNSAAGCSDGQNYLYTSGVVPTTFTHFSMSPVHSHVSITADTKYYLKGYVSVFTVGNPKFRGSIWATKTP